MRFLGVVSLFTYAWAHGVLTNPPSRNGGTYLTAGGCPDQTSSNGHDICSWMTNGVNIQPPETLPSEFITTGPDAQFCTTNPWRKPGSIAIDQPCGHVGGSDGRNLPVVKTVNVAAGGDLEVAWAINANHGGGYAYRLCPSYPTPTEECFQRTILTASARNFNKAWVQKGDDVSSRKEIPMMRTIKGTYPPGSEWTRNPIPDRQDYFPPPNNDQSLVGHGPFTWSIVEYYMVPANLTTGNYVLSWRWDCEGSPQIWLNCADVYVTGSGPAPPTPKPPVPTPAPPTPPTPPPSPATCGVQTSSSRDCGWVGIDEAGCEKQGCCWRPVNPNPSNLPWCFYKQ